MCLGLFFDEGQVTIHIPIIALASRNGGGTAAEDQTVRPSIAPCLGLEFPLGHSSGEAEVSEETPLCPDRLGLRQWLMHNGGTQHRGKVSESITAAADNSPPLQPPSLSLAASVSGWNGRRFAKKLSLCLHCSLNHTSVWLLNSNPPGQSVYCFVFAKHSAFLPLRDV